MNKTITMGRLVRDPEARSSSTTSIANFTLAVDRKFKSQSGERETDFINFVAFGKTAENICKYFSKGSKILIEGRLQVRNWEDKDGNKRTSYEIVVTEFDFVESRSDKPISYTEDEEEPYDL